MTERQFAPNLSNYGPAWALTYAVQEMVKAGYSDEQIMGWLDFILYAERASQEHTDNDRQGIRSIEISDPTEG